MQSMEKELKPDAVRKSMRMIELYEHLIKGGAISKGEVARKYGVTEKSIQRDIDDLRAFIWEKDKRSLVYNRVDDDYALDFSSSNYLSCKQITAISKILLESRAFNKTEIEELCTNLIAQASPAESKTVKDTILNERHHYMPLCHEKPLIDLIWDANQYINDKKIIKMEYIRQDQKKVSHRVKPVALTFSDYYFYLIAYICEKEKDFPAVFRLDRCMNMQQTKEKFFIPYAKKFNVGEFQNRVQFMYPGKLITVKFEFWGSSIEAVLDRLPTATKQDLGNGHYLVQAEVYGKGIKMWLLSQMEFLEVLEPRELREDMIACLDKTRALYVKQDLK